MEMGKQPKDVGNSQSIKAPKHSSSGKIKTKHIDQAQEAQNWENPSTSQDWRDCEAETSARDELARVIHKQPAPMGATVKLKSAPVKFPSKK